MAANDTCFGNVLCVSRIVTTKNRVRQFVLLNSSAVNVSRMFDTKQDTKQQISQRMFGRLCVK